MFRELTPDQVYEKLQEQDNSLLIDCRTQAEWVYVGIADISKTKGKMALIEWVDNSGQPNPEFLSQIAQHAGKKTNIYVMCRSGARSAAACMSLMQEGYTNICNVAEGFEGDLDGKNQRGFVNGWRYHNLPWQQR